MKKHLTVTVGIPAFQAERNIRNLLTSISQQQTDVCKIEEILVYSDGSTDRTTEMVRTVKDPRLTVFESKKNRGYAATLGFLIKKSKSDVFVTFNDDILIPDPTTVEKLILPFLRDRSVTFVSGNIEALHPKTFIGKCVYTSYLSFIPIRQGIRGGQNMYSCDGKILALRRDFSRSVSLNHASTSTVDIFLYFENLRFGGVYRFVRDAVVRFRIPETMRDWRNLQTRTVNAHQLMEKEYGALYKRESNIPFGLYLRSVFPVIYRYPLESLLFKLLINAAIVPSHNPSFKRWELTTSTKTLHHVL